MHNPFEEFIKKAIFLIGIGFWISTTETFKKTSFLFKENKKILKETQQMFDRTGTHSN